ncbi:MAG: hypothetical protein KC613_24105 [Myxococcales bacterium]|nr:hypothetical protein [Myxococcales bacterium]MCB9526171.1 hypothetical protein [Myxococcales bacterium]
MHARLAAIQEAAAALGLGAVHVEAEGRDGFTVRLDGVTAQVEATADPRPALRALREQVIERHVEQVRGQCGVDLGAALWAAEALVAAYAEGAANGGSVSWEALDGAHAWASRVRNGRQG